MIRILPFLLISLLFLPSCSVLGLATGAAASAGVAASQEGGLSRAVDDARIQIAINDLWFKYDVETFRKLDLTINQGRVLITGVVQNPEARVEAVRLAWQPEGVTQVINEIQVKDSAGITGFAKDAWITTRLRGALTFDREILSINYSIDTVQGTVYLMGFAQNRAELNRVIETARTIKGVNGVVSYVKFVGAENVNVDPQADNQNSYRSTYDDNVRYEDGASAEYPAYVDTQTPLDARAPQTQEFGADAYPNNVNPVQIERLDDPIVIRGDPLTAPVVETPSQPTVSRQGIDSETILWDGQ